MADQNIIKAIAKWGKDKLGNIIAYKTLTRCVFDDDGNRLSDILASGGTGTAALMTNEDAGIGKPDGTTIEVKENGIFGLTENKINGLELDNGGIQWLNVSVLKNAIIGNNTVDAVSEEGFLNVYYTQVYQGQKIFIKGTSINNKTLDGGFLLDSCEIGSPVAETLFTDSLIDGNYSIITVPYLTNDYDKEIYLGINASPNLINDIKIGISQEYEGIKQKFFETNYFSSNNLLEIPKKLESFYENGINITPVYDDYNLLHHIHVYGTAKRDVYYPLNEEGFYLPSGSYYISDGNQKNGSSSHLAYQNNQGHWYHQNGIFHNFPDNLIRVYIRIEDSETVEENIYPMIYSADWYGKFYSPWFPSLTRLSRIYADNSPTIRYDETTDYIQVKVNSEWKNYKRAYMNLDTGETKYIKFVFSRLNANGNQYVSLKELKLKKPNGEYLDFTSYNTEATAFNQTNANENAEKVIDNNLTTKWVSPWTFTSEKYLQIYFKNDTVKLGAYNTLELYVGDDSNRIPISFDIMISTDGDNWTTIVSETNITPLSTTSGELFYTTTLNF